MTVSSRVIHGGQSSIPVIYQCRLVNKAFESLVLNSQWSGQSMSDKDFMPVLLSYWLGAGCCRFY